MHLRLRAQDSLLFTVILSTIVSSVAARSHSHSRHNKKARNHHVTALELSLEHTEDSDVPFVPAYYEGDYEEQEEYLYPIQLRFDEDDEDEDYSGYQETLQLERQKASRRKGSKIGVEKSKKLKKFDRPEPAETSISLSTEEEEQSSERRSEVKPRGRTMSKTKIPAAMVGRGVTPVRSSSAAATVQPSGKGAKSMKLGPTDEELAAEFLGSSVPQVTTKAPKPRKKPSMESSVTEATTQTPRPRKKPSMAGRGIGFMRTATNLRTTARPKSTAPATMATQSDETETTVATMSEPVDETTLAPTTERTRPATSGRRVSKAQSGRGIGFMRSVGSVQVAPKIEQITTTAIVPIETDAPTVKPAAEVDTEIPTPATSAPDEVPARRRASKSKLGQGVGRGVGRGVKVWKHAAPSEVPETVHAATEETPEITTTAVTTAEATTTAESKHPALKAEARVATSAATESQDRTINTEAEMAPSSASGSEDQMVKAEAEMAPIAPSESGDQNVKPEATTAASAAANANDFPETESREIPSKTTDEFTVTEDEKKPSKPAESEEPPVAAEVTESNKEAKSEDTAAASDADATTVEVTKSADVPGAADGKESATEAKPEDEPQTTSGNEQDTLSKSKELPDAPVTTKPDDSNEAVDSTVPAPEPITEDDIEAIIEPRSYNPKTGLIATDPNTIEFWLYHDSKNPDSYDVIKLNDTKSLQSSHYDQTLPLKVLIHGFQASGKSKFPQNVKNAYLSSRSSRRSNIVVVNWAELAILNTRVGLNDVIKYHNKVAGNVPTVGRRVGQFVTWLKNEGKLGELSNVHFIGFCLGAHVAAAAANVLKKVFGEKPGRISALDPAGPSFGKDEYAKCLRRTDANFVDVIHTASGGYGIADSIGQADFYVNGGKDQESCASLDFGKKGAKPLRKALCSHYKATEYWARRVLDGPDNAVCACPHVEKSKKSKKKANSCSIKTVFGEFCDPESKGAFDVSYPS